MGLVLLVGTSASAYAVLWFIDFGTLADNPIALFQSPQAVAALTSFSEVTVGVLGIAITVVAIIVELAATRYTPRISELFVRDPVNVAMMGTFTVTSVLVVWINTSLFGPHHPPTMALAATGLMTLSLLAILPYFAYVFDFLSPHRVIQTIQRKGSRAIMRLGRTGAHLDRCRGEITHTIEQLGDIALNSVDKKDKPLAIAAVSALAEVARTSIEHKDSLPEAWFRTKVLVRTDQDFIAFHPDIVRNLEHRRTWVEMKVLRQYQALFSESIHRMRDINHLLAILTRRIALVAMDQGDMHSVHLCERFMNTYMRAGLNAQDVRTCYNLLNEYRAMAESALEREQHRTVHDLADRIKYYAQLAFSRNMGFLLETAAYDLCQLLELAADGNADCHDDLLATFLELDREPDGGKVQEASLRGVRKAQIKLATYYLVRGMEPEARRIFMDMKGEKLERMRGIRRQLEAVESSEFWEVSDRGINFEWLPEDRRAQLETFFGWFEGL